MGEPRYVPAKVKSFLSKVYVGHYSNFDTCSYIERVERQRKREEYECSLPLDPNPFFEEILQAGEVSDEERRLIKSVWLNGNTIIDIPKPALEIFKRLADSERVQEKLDSIIQD